MNRWLPTAAALLACALVQASEWYELPTSVKDADKRLGELTAQLKKTPKDAALNFEAAKILHFYKNDQKAALAHLRTATEANLGDAAAWNLRGLTESAMLDFAAAIRSSLKAIKADPDHPASMGALARVGQLRGQVRGYSQRVKARLEALYKRQDYRNPDVRDGVRRLLEQLYEESRNMAAAERVRRDAGWVEEWRVVGPFGKFMVGAMGTAFPPETEDQPQAQYIRDPAMAGSGRETLAPKTGRFIREVVRPGSDTEEGAYYFTTYVKASQPTDVLLHVASGYSLKVFVNRRAVLASDRLSSWQPIVHEQGLRLPQGWSKLVVKLMASKRARPSFRLRLRGANGLAAKVATQAEFGKFPSIANQPAPATFDAYMGSWTKLGKLCAQKPAPAWPALMLAQQHAERGDREEAKALFFAAQKRLPRYALLAQAIGDLVQTDLSLYPNVRRSRAREWYRKSLEMWPDCAMGLDRLSRLDMLDRQHKEALKKIAECEKLKPGLPAWMQRRYEAMRAKGWNYEALQAYRALDAALPDSARAAELALPYLEDSGNFDLYQQAARKIAAHNPRSSALASFYERSRQYAKAEAELAQLATIRPSSAFIRRRQAIVQQKLGRYGPALADFERLRQLEGDTAAVFLARARLQWLMGDAKPALRSLKDAFRLAPSDVRLHRSLVLLGVPDVTERFAVTYEQVMADRQHHDLPHPGVASAFLLDQAILVLNPDGSSVERVHQIVKVYNKKGVADWADVSVPARAELLELRTIKPDGSALEPERIPNKPTWTMPGLSPGDMVEMEYLEVNAPPFFPGAYLGPVFSFKDERMHMERSQYIIVAPKEWKLTIDARNRAPKLSETLLHGRRVYKWEALASKEAGDLPNSVPRFEALPSVRVAYNVTWQDAQHKIISGIAGRTRLSYELNQVVTTIAAKHKTAKARLQAAYDYVSDHIDGTVSTGYFGMSASAILSVGKGNRVVVLKALLDGLGVASQFVVVAPRTGPHISRKCPDMYGRSFTSCVLRVKIEGQDDVWVDTSFRHLPLGYLLPAHRQSWGLVLDAREPNPLFLTPEQPDSKDLIRTESEIVVSPRGEASATVRESYIGLFGATMRDRFQKMRAPQRRYARERRIAALNSGATLTTFEIDDLKNCPKPIVFRYSYTAPRFVRLAGKRGAMRVGFYPMLPGRRYARERARKAALLVSWPIVVEDVVRIKLPVGMTVVMPTNVDQKTPFGQCRYTYRMDGQVLVAERSIKIPIQRVPGKLYKRFADFVRGIDKADLREIEVRVTPTAVPKKA